MENAFVTISENGMKADPPSLSDESGGSSSFNTPPSRTHDTSCATYHLKDLEIFAKRLQTAAKATLPNYQRGRQRARYKDTEVILIRWDGEDRLGVAPELEDLGKVFTDAYGFKTRTWLIPTDGPLVEIMTKVLALLKEPDIEDKLLIVYYAGHAAMNDTRQQIWLRTSNWEQGALEWFAIQPLFVNTKSDVLFLLDCCAAAAATVTPNSRIGVKETIGACAFESRAPEPGAFSFTNTLIEVLEAWKLRPMFSAAMLHNEILARLKHPKPLRDMFGNMSEFRRSPVYVVTTTNPLAVSIELASTIQPQKLKRMHSDSELPAKRKRVGSEGSRANSPLSSPLSSPEENTEANPPVLDIDPYSENQLHHILPEGNFTIPHVLISLALEGEQLLDFGAWTRWVADVPALASCAKIEGIYKSHSTLLILSVPVVIWDWLPEDLSCTFIGYVDSVNHAKESSWTDRWNMRTWLENAEPKYPERVFPDEDLLNLELSEFHFTDRVQKRYNLSAYEDLPSPIFPGHDIAPDQFTRTRRFSWSDIVPLPLSAYPPLRFPARQNSFGTILNGPPTRQSSWGTISPPPSLFDASSRSDASPPFQRNAGSPSPPASRAGSDGGQSSHSFASPVGTRVIPDEPTEAS